MKVLLTGGGTGGHITPLLAVAQALKELDSHTEVIYVGERGSKFKSMTAGETPFDSQYEVFAGKFRRYNGRSRLEQLLDVKTNLLNLRDLFYFLFGTIESWFLLRKLKPDVILLKGGFVGVPIGLAARKHIPIVTHDSDALPGLANRLVSRWAVYHATGMPPEFYQYPKSKIKYVGVIVADTYKKVDMPLLQEYRRSLQIPADAEVLMITGGSLGAKVINTAVTGFAPELLEARPNLHIIHQVGNGNEAIYGDYRNERLSVTGLLSELYRSSGAADVIIARAGANTMAEFGVQAKACVVVPNPLLTGGHQLKNADFLAQQDAVVVVDEKNLETHPEVLKDAVTDLLDNADKRAQFGKKLNQLAVPHAAQNLAKLLIESAGRAGE